MPKLLSVRTILIPIPATVHFSIISKFGLLIILLTSATIANAQIVFEEGYYVNNENETTTCLIKNYDWAKNPTQFKYKLFDTSNIETAHINNVKEFMIGGAKYKRHTVDIDQSSSVLSALDENNEPEFVNKTMFLKVIIEGRASLFIAGLTKRYFYSVNDSKVSQLIYKEYLTNNRVTTNNTFKSQLWEDLNCSCIPIADISDLNYFRKDLINIFEKYNTCVNSVYKNYDQKVKRDCFNLSIKPGIRYSTLTVSNSYNSIQNIDFGGNLNFCIGLEAELVLPFNKNKWGLTIEPTYQYYKAEDPRPNYRNDVDYKSLELPIGIKYNMFTGAKSKLFLSASYLIYDFTFNSTISYMEVISSHNFNFGLGYIYNNKFILKFNLSTPRELLMGYAFYSSSYQSYSVIIGYNIF